jgi:ubiquinone biosynthesis protein UbiJ
LPASSRLTSRAAVAAVNHLLEREPWAREKLAPFSGRTLRVLMPGGALVLEVASGGFLVVSKDGGTGTRDGADPADYSEVTVPFGALIDYMVDPSRADPTRIAGEPQLAETVRFLAAHLRWDAEDDLARVLGDVAAHRILHLVRTLRAFPREAMPRLLEGIAEYLSEEKQFLTGRPSLEVLTADIAALDRAADALESRVGAVEARHISSR